jgi:hypothetical protein
MELKGEQISLVLLAAVALEGEFVEISSLARPRNAFRRRDVRQQRRLFALFGLGDFTSDVRP